MDMAYARNAQLINQSVDDIYEWNSSSFWRLKKYPSPSKVSQERFLLRNKRNTAWFFFRFCGRHRSRSTPISIFLNLCIQFYLEHRNDSNLFGNHSLWLAASDFNKKFLINSANKLSRVRLVQCWQNSTSTWKVLSLSRMQNFWYRFCHMRSFQDNFNWRKRRHWMDGAVAQTPVVLIERRDFRIKFIVEISLLVRSTIKNFVDTLTRSSREKWHGASWVLESWCSAVSKHVIELGRFKKKNYEKNFLVIHHYETLILTFKCPDFLCYFQIVTIVGFCALVINQLLHTFLFS